MTAGSKHQVTNRIAAAWALALGLIFIFSAPLAEKLWIMYLPIHWGIALIGVGILITATVQATVQRRGRLLIPAILICAIGLAMYFTIGFRIGRLTLFQIRKSHYEELLAEATRSGEAPGAEGYTDAGPPVRHAFFWQRGVTDNWAGVVYDPSGQVMIVNQAEGWSDLRDSGRHQVVDLFGGTLFKCESLGGHWYLCWFT